MAPGLEQVNWVGRAPAALAGGTDIPPDLYYLEINDLALAVSSRDICRIRAEWYVLESSHHQGEFPVISENRMRPCKAVSTLALLVLAALGVSSPVLSQAVKAPYPAMAPVEQYRIANREDEIALARSAAPPSISADAEVLVLARDGYETAVKGKNGFVCFVERSWAAGFDDPDFWNPRLRGPNCFNAPAARTELPRYLERTEWVLAGATKQQLIEKTKTAIASHRFKSPEAGAISFMLSKEGYLGDQVAGPWLPHIMFFLPHGQAVNWGAGKEGSPIIGQDGSDIESTVLFVPVRSWSDGSPAPSPPKKHQM
jgi:hypothetical protein